MFGVYENFPDMFHSIGRFTCRTPTEKLQRVLIQSLHGLNRSNGSLDFPELARENIRVELDLGIADGLTFNYLDSEILVECQERLHGQVLPALDFLCIVRYYIAEKKETKKRNPLRFDYFMLRFLFGGGEVELRIFHEKGTRRLSIEDLINSLIERINQGLGRKKLSPLKMSYVRTI